MRLLLFSDLHCDVAASRNLAERAASVDVVIGAGDFANVRKGIERCIKVLRAIPIPAILVAGNNETTEELTEACRLWPSAHVLHGSGVKINGVDFFGIGGGIPVTPFGSWSHDFTDEQAAELLHDCPAGGILVTHSPPFGTLDVSSSGKSLGSVAVRDAILRVRPRPVVCGHVHASGGKTAKLEGTTVVNAGPGGVELDLEQGGGI